MVTLQWVIDILCLHVLYFHYQSCIILLSSFLLNFKTHFRFNSLYSFSIFLPTSFPKSFYPFFSVPQLVCFKMSSPYQSTLAAFHRFVIDASYGKPAEECGLNCNVAVPLGTNVDDNASRVGTATLCSVHAMKTAPCSDRCTITPSPTTAGVTSS